MQSQLRGDACIVFEHGVLLAEGRLQLSRDSGAVGMSARLLPESCVGLAASKPLAHSLARTPTHSTFLPIPFPPLPAPSLQFGFKMKLSRKEVRTEVNAPVRAYVLYIYRYIYVHVYTYR